MTTGSLLAVCLVHGLLPTKDATGVTAIDKRAVEGPVKVHPLGLTGDLQASRKHHGGESKALYAYSQADAEYWEQELGRSIEPGLFGENLRIAGLDATGALIGERWRIGADVEVEVTCPRTPCRNFQQRMQVPNWVHRFAEAGLVGTYLQVRRRGSIAAGDPIEVLTRPAHGVTVRDVFRGLDQQQAEALEASRIAGEIRLSPEIQKVLRTMAAKSAAKDRVQAVPAAI
ncbi:MOSC domain-containing protein [Arthrobacter sp. zg-Y20]|uniref:MOSC domain-containing protein n=1 Tax=unclassified Arthrobacter TaxID=235627 RepID=UPI001D13319D|nr:MULTISPECIES: MOSC domain-containing protein [unclassified Arthrobacter]MCC3276025.1 MOSC domain-containing protein [Arthrobacter sp. zg-Y20]MDK1316182.1 MOSC domain-containing protein [Arthrobacter sp. zg.Y20]WIB05536.1 MOSC domain-containing protein [Arthrobacter sp. zg-Y20]